MFRYDGNGGEGAGKNIQTKEEMETELNILKNSKGNIRKRTKITAEQTSRIIRMNHKSQEEPRTRQRQGLLRHTE